MDNVYAFIDEAGGFGFDFEKAKTTTHFVVSAVIIPEKVLQELETNVETIRKKYFQTGEMKSAKIGNNEHRRGLILKELSPLDFKVYSIVIDKREILETSGLVYKKTFYKFLNDKLHSELRKAYPNLVIFSDKTGRKEYMDSFRQYVFKHTQMSMFEYFNFSFEDSKDSVLIQLADFICGTIWHLHEESKLHSMQRDFLAVFKNQIYRIDEWPKNFIKKIQKKNNSNELDELIAQTSLRQANSFIEKNDNTDYPQLLEQLAVIKYLKFIFLNWDRYGYVYTEEIINSLSSLLGKKIERHYLRTNIIAKLRDAGVIIASSRKGYKIPATVSELLEFTEHANNNVTPMLNRMKKCRDIIRMATMDKLDIFDIPGCEDIKNFCDVKDGVSK